MAMPSNCLQLCWVEENKGNYVLQGKLNPLSPFWCVPQGPLPPRRKRVCSGRHPNRCLTLPLLPTTVKRFQIWATVPKQPTVHPSASITNRGQREARNRAGTLPSHVPLHHSIYRLIGSIVERHSGVEQLQLCQILISNFKVMGL